ncbi:MAG: hypothetical protein ACM3UP_00790 [Methanocella sp.]
MKRLSILAMAAFVVLAIMALPALAEVPAGAIPLVEDGENWLYWIPGPDGGQLFHSNSIIAQASGLASATVQGYIRLAVNGSEVTAGPGDDLDWFGLVATTYDVPAPNTPSDDIAPASQVFNVEVKSNSAYYMDGYATNLYKDLSGWSWPPAAGSVFIPVEGRVDSGAWHANGPGWISKTSPTAGDTFTYEFQAKTGWLTQKGSYGGQICFAAWQP